MDRIDPDEQVNTNTCLGAWKALLLGPLPASRARVTESLSREEQEQEQEQLGPSQL